MDALVLLTTKNIQLLSYTNELIDIIILNPKPKLRHEWSVSLRNLLILMHTIDWRSLFRHVSHIIPVVFMHEIYKSITIIAENWSFLCAGKTPYAIHAKPLYAQHPRI